MFSRPIELYFIDNSQKENKYNKIKSYYWDYICTHREKTELNISRKLIQTNEYQQRIQNSEILVSLFKKEIK